VKLYALYARAFIFSLMWKGLGCCNDKYCCKIVRQAVELEKAIKKNPVIATEIPVV